MKESYCIYTDRVIPKEQVSREHIIPLSLGGSNEFVVEVSSFRNSELGSQIDGNLGNDLAMQFLRKHHKTRGHRNRKAIVSLRKSRLVPSNMPVQVHFREGGVEVYDPIN